MEFIAQINCAEAGSAVLPDRGLLLFFYDNRHGGYSIKDKGFIRVIYFDDKTELIERASPSQLRPRLWGFLGHSVLPRIYQEERLIFTTGVSLPDLERKLLHLVDADTEEAYCDLKEEMEETRFIQIGGFPNPVKADGMEQYIAQITGHEPPEAWIMILEIYEDKITDIMWGDAGKLYFFCHSDDLKNLDFSNCWMQMQCG